MALRTAGVTTQMVGSPTRPEVVGRDEDGLDFRHVGETQGRVVVEVGLSDAAVLDGDLAIEGGAQAVDDRALDLRGDLLRLTAWPQLRARTIRWTFTLPSLSTETSAVAAE